MTIYGVYVTSQKYDSRTEEYDGCKKSLLQLCSSKEVANQLISKLIEEKVSGMKEKDLSQEIIDLVEKNLISINYSTLSQGISYEYVPLYEVNTVSVVTEV
jgi:hypothetical protein